MRSAWSGKSLMQSWWMSLAARRADFRASILLKSAAVMRSCPSKHSTMRRAVSAGELDGQYQLVWCLRKWEMERVMVPYWRLVSAGRVEIFRVGSSARTQDSRSKLSSRRKQSSTQAPRGTSQPFRQRPISNTEPSPSPSPTFSNITPTGTARPIHPHSPHAAW